MPPTKTPTSSLSAIELLINRVRYRTLAGMRRMRSGADSETASKCSSPATRLPLEVIKMVTAYLIHDTPSLLASSLTCYSWYIAVVPHLHHTLIISTDSLRKSRRRVWSNPLLRKKKLGLLPLVEVLWVWGDNSSHDGFSSKLFNPYTLRPLFAFTNINELRIDYLDIPSFMPKIQRCFGHFSPALRFLTLGGPKGSRRQIIYFIGLFQHLEDLRLFYDRAEFQEEPADDPTLVPSFVPPLRGWLILVNFTRVDLLKDMVDLFGGIRFRYMNIFDVVGMRLLLDACADTLESVVLDPTDPRVRSSLQDFDLSRNKSLLTVQVEAGTIDDALRAGPPDFVLSFFKHTLSTITSLKFSEVTILYQDYDFRGIRSAWNSYWPPFHEMTQAERAEETSWHHRLFGVYREVHKVRGFSLVLCADVWSPAVDYSMRMLEEAIATEKEGGGFDSSFPQPSVTDNPHETRAGRRNLSRPS